MSYSGAVTLGDLDGSMLEVGATSIYERCSVHYPQLAWLETKRRAVRLVPGISRCSAVAAHKKGRGWAITTYKPKRGRSVIVEPPRRNLLDTEKLRGAFAPAPLNVRAVLSRPRRRLCKEGAMENAQPPTRPT